jgi:integrase
MGSVNRRGSGTLFFDFRVKGQRCREYTSLQDTPANRKKLQKVLDRMELDMATETFEYRRYFPNSAMASRFDTPAEAAATPIVLAHFISPAGSRIDSRGMLAAFPH